MGGGCRGGRGRRSEEGGQIATGRQLLGPSSRCEPRLDAVRLLILQADVPWQTGGEYLGLSTKKADITGNRGLHGPEYEPLLYLFSFHLI